MSTEPPTIDFPIGEILPLEKDPDTQALIEKLMTGKPLEPEVYRRIRAAGERATEEYARRNGITNIAAELIREARDSE
jgi:hypothetical protein